MVATLNEPPAAAPAKSPSSGLGAQTRRELLALLLASLACVVVLIQSLTESRQLSVAGLSTDTLLLIALVAGGAAAAAGLVMLLTARARNTMRTARSETSRMRRDLALAETIFQAEPQVLVFWDQREGLRVMTHTLTTVAGVPDAQPDLLKFGGWLDQRSADEFKSALDQLFENGKPFNLFLKTRRGGHLEGDGRTTGSQAVLRLRDVAGYRQDLARIIEQHHQLKRDIRSSRSLLDAMPIPVWLRTQSGELEWVNAAYVTAVEAASPAEVIDRQIELLETRQRALLTDAMKQHAILDTIAKGRQRGTATDTQPPARRSATLTRRLPLVVSGERKTHDVIVVPLDGATAAAAIDVAELETAQGALDRHSLATDRTLDRVATAVAIFDREQCLTFYNEAYRRLWQLDPAWLDRGPRNAEVLDRLRELSRLPAMVEYRSFKAQLLALYEQTTAYEDHWQLADGRDLHVIVEPRPDGGVTYLLDDISGRITIEGRFNALIQAQRETLDSLKEGVAVFATDGRLRLFNQAFGQIWRMSRPVLEQGPHIEDVIAHGRSLYDGDEIWQRLVQTITAFSDARKPESGQMVRHDGSVIDYSTIPLPDGGTLVKFADVTASKRYERALEERNDALIAADRLKSRFIGHVSYELRTPLTNIIGFSELLASPRTGPLNDKQRDYLNDISVSSRTLLSIIDDILDLATMDAGALELKLGPVDAHPLIEAAVTGVRERAGRARLTLDIGLADDIGTFIADESRVRQILYNLLSNAVGFSNSGDTVEFSCWREGSWIVFSVADRGVGIPKDEQTRIFERFVTDSQGSRHRGAGLGLSIVKSLVDLHGGSIDLSSEPGQGTRVTVRLPADGIANRTAGDADNTGLRPAAAG